MCTQSKSCSFCVSSNCLKNYAMHNSDVIAHDLIKCQEECKNESCTRADILDEFRKIHIFLRSCRHSTCQLAVRTLTPPFSIGSDGDLVLETADCAHMLCHPSEEKPIVPTNEILKETLFSEYETLQASWPTITLWILPQATTSNIMVLYVFSEASRMIWSILSVSLILSAAIEVKLKVHYYNISSSINCSNYLNTFDYYLQWFLLNAWSNG